MWGGTYRDASHEVDRVGDINEVSGQGRVRDVLVVAVARRSLGAVVRSEAEQVHEVVDERGGERIINVALRGDRGARGVGVAALSDGRGHGNSRGSGAANGDSGSASGSAGGSGGDGHSLRGSSRAGGSRDDGRGDGRGRAACTTSGLDVHGLGGGSRGEGGGLDLGEAKARAGAAVGIGVASAGIVGDLVGTHGHLGAFPVVAAITGDSRGDGNCLGSDGGGQKAGAVTAPKVVVTKSTLSSDGFEASVRSAGAPPRAGESTAGQSSQRQSNRQVLHFEGEK